MLTNDEGGLWWGGGGILHHFEFKAFCREFEWCVMNSVFSWKGTIQIGFMVLPPPGLARQGFVTSTIWQEICSRKDWPIFLLLLRADLRCNALCNSKQDWFNLYGLWEKYFQCMFIIPPPSLTSSFPLDRNFSKGVRFSNKSFPEVAPQKNVSSYFSPSYYTTPVPSLTPWLRSSVFDIFGQWWPGAYMNADM